MLVGSYSIDPNEVIGSGIQGKVVKGRNVYTEEVVAIKMFSSEVHESFKTETHYLAQLLDSKGDIIQLKASFISQDVRCIVMPLCPNDLMNLIHARQITSASAKKYFIQICLALQFTHKNGIAHLDIKPENVLIDNNDQCVLCDFGHASGINDLVIGRGTKAYNAPEALGNDPYDPVPADIWSLGILLYVMISGCFPRSPTQAEDDDTTNLYAWRHYFGSSSFHLVSQMLRHHPNDRISLPDILKHPWCRKAEKPTKLSGAFAAACRFGKKQAAKH